MNVCPSGFHSTTNGDSVYAIFRDAQVYAQYLLHYVCPGDLPQKWWWNHTYEFHASVPCVPIVLFILKEIISVVLYTSHSFYKRKSHQIPYRWVLEDDSFMKSSIDWEEIDLTNTSDQCRALLGMLKWLPVFADPHWQTAHATGHREREKPFKEKCFSLVLGCLITHAFGSGGGDDGLFANTIRSKWHMSCVNKLLFMPIFHRCSNQTCTLTSNGWHQQADHVPRMDARLLRVPCAYAVRRPSAWIIWHSILVALTISSRH